ncbi:MAG: diphosphate--fructose-6-phosphate 1-phosphotransferase [Anaerococcus sp.]|nr:diphosphate--fructose-6-phosphate 1-phosphotransferase [Anaerococcus sp.]
MKKNLLIIHGGGPTGVINVSLAGAIRAGQKNPNVGKIFGARNGMGGLLREDFIDLSNLTKEETDLIINTPGSAIGTSRDPLEEKDYKKAREILVKNNIGYCLLNGGNGTMNTCAKLAREMEGTGVKVLGIPKTMDNDLGNTDHAPGFGSAARYMAEITKELVADVKGLPIHVVILEAMGRNAGWVTGAGALANDQEGFGPDLILLPEVAFDEEKFLAKIKELRKKKSGLVVLASEGLKDKDGKFITKPIFKSDRAVYYGDVGSHLANLIISKLNIKARAERPGLLMRSSISLRSEVDVKEAYEVGKFAVEKISQGENSAMVAIERISNDPYQVAYKLVGLSEGIIEEKIMDESYISEDGFYVSDKYLAYLRPLVGNLDNKMISLN